MQPLATQPKRHSRPKNPIVPISPISLGVCFDWETFAGGQCRGPGDRAAGVESPNVPMAPLSISLLCLC